MHMSVKIGDKAPQFTLFDHQRKEVSLSDFQGKNVVLLFFPAAFTGVCTTELCSTRDDIATYNGLNAQVLGISVDSPFALGKYHEEQNLNFPLLSDFNAAACTAYGAKYDNFVFGMQNVARRSAFVIDGNGAIRYAEVLESAGDLPNFAAVKETLENLK
jgi:peroxiredoxin